MSRIIKHHMSVLEIDLTKSKIRTIIKNTTRQP